MGNIWQIADGHFVKSGKIFKFACFEKLSGQIDNHSLYLNTLSIQQADRSSMGTSLKIVQHRFTLMSKLSHTRHQRSRHLWAEVGTPGHVAATPFRSRTSPAKIFKLRC